MSEGGLFCRGAVSGVGRGREVMVWWVSCVWAVCGMEGGDMGRVRELDVAGSGVACGEW